MIKMKTIIFSTEKHKVFLVHKAMPFCMPKTGGFLA